MENSVFLGREALLQKDALKVEKVELTRGFVFVREMTSKDKDAWEQSMLKKIPTKEGFKYETTLDDFRAKLAVSTVCDENGDLLFTPKDTKDLNKMMSASNMEKIVEVAQRLNAITDKEKEEIVKNLEADLEDGSNSESAEN